MTDFSTITACGECCVGCAKKIEGSCPGCIEADGHVPEWTESGRCKVHACAREHGGYNFTAFAMISLARSFPQRFHGTPLLSIIFQLSEMSTTNLISADTCHRRIKIFPLKKYYLIIHSFPINRKNTHFVYVNLAVSNKFIQFISKLFRIFVWQYLF